MILHPSTYFLVPILYGGLANKHVLNFFKISGKFILIRCPKIQELVEAQNQRIL